MGAAHHLNLPNVLLSRDNQPRDHSANRAALPPVLEQICSEKSCITERGHVFGKPAQNLSMSFNKIVFLLFKGARYGLQKFQTFQQQKIFLPLLYKDRML